MKKQSYASAKGIYVQTQMKLGVSKNDANRAWSHGKNNPRSQWMKDHPQVDDEYFGDEYFKVDRPEWVDYAYTSDDL